MGLISDFLNASVGIDHNLPIDPLDRRAYRELQALEDEGAFALPASLQAADELQSIAIYVPTVSGGTFTLEFVLASDETFTTAGIAFDANAATIEGAIDTAATTASIVGWTNGDISVAGGPLTTTPVTLTFDGTSVKEQNHDLVVMDDGSLSGGGSGGVITTTTEGQSDRLGYGILTQYGILAGTVPAEDVVPTALAAAASPGERRLSAETIQAIALEIAVTEGNNLAISDAIVAAAGV
jgi:hypothetical protein